MSANEFPAANEFPKLTAFEVSLASLALQPAALDRESLFFQAGREAALREAGSQRSWLCRWGWPTGFSVMTAIAAALLAMLSLRAEPITVPPVAGTTPEVAAATAAPFVLPDRDPRQEDRLAGIVTYSGLCDEILREGINARLPETVASDEATAVAARPMSYEELLNQILQEQ